MTEQAGGFRYDPDRDEGMVHTVAHKLTGLTSRNPDYADACQVARLALFKAAPTWKPGMIPWHLYGYIAAYRAVQKWFRVHRRRGFTQTHDHPIHGDGRLPPPQVEDVAASDEKPGREDDPAAAVAEAELAASVRQAVGRLPEPARGAAEALMRGEPLTTYATDRGKSLWWAWSVLKSQKTQAEFAPLA